MEISELIQVFELRHRKDILILNSILSCCALVILMYFRGPFWDETFIDQCKYILAFYRINFVPLSIGAVVSIVGSHFIVYPKFTKLVYLRRMTDDVDVPKSRFYWHTALVMVTICSIFATVPYLHLRITSASTYVVLLCVSCIPFTLMFVPTHEDELMHPPKIPTALKSNIPEPIRRLKKRYFASPYVMTKPQLLKRGNCVCSRPNLPHEDDSYKYLVYHPVILSEDAIIDSIRSGINVDVTNLLYFRSLEKDGTYGRKLIEFWEERRVNNFGNPVGLPLRRGRLGLVVLEPIEGRIEEDLFGDLQKVCENVQDFKTLDIDSPKVRACSCLPLDDSDVKYCNRLVEYAKAHCKKLDLSVKSFGVTLYVFFDSTAVEFVRTLLYDKGYYADIIVGLPYADSTDSSYKAALIINIFTYHDSNSIDKLFLLLGEHSGVFRRG